MVSCQAHQVPCQRDSQIARCVGQHCIRQRCQVHFQVLVELPGGSGGAGSVVGGDRREQPGWEPPCVHGLCVAALESPTGCFGAGNGPVGGCCEDSINL